eukprot:CAMPEP_0198213626 /NCGR_PEP_ID=MMETSP1445-20131203/28975_1 /TAXON_ID=36898 /ORGANISM="Pyramimonas sp., Strain CCMP2087" /LENGTH=233 /DNA_ID=CAMNT_0043888297 /DNA_START=389 /DNA_END=1087 /DNA_ORIENTATION=+
MPPVIYAMAIAHHCSQSNRCQEAMLRYTSCNQSKHPVATRGWALATPIGLYTTGAPRHAPCSLKHVWSQRLTPTVGNLFQRQVSSTAASPQPIDFKPTSVSTSASASTAGAEGVQVVLFGWLGAQDKYLEKYAELWKSKGADVFMYTPPITATLFPFQADRSVAHYERAIKAHRASAPAPKAVVYHVFSNGGFLFMGALLRGVSRGLVAEEALGNVSGIIIDSAPGVINEDMA